MIHDIAAIGELLYGRDWRGQLAQELGLTRRTMQRWADKAPPAEHPCWEQLARLLAAHQQQISSAMEE